jgi:hypothetical protein
MINNYMGQMFEGRRENNDQKEKLLAEYSG